MRVFARLFGIVLVAMALLSPSAARAESLADEAELHFQLGAEAYQNGDLRTALSHFLLSNRLAPNKNVVFNIARTYERLDRFADAHRYYLDARAAEQDAATTAQIDEALERIAPKVAVLDVVTDPPGATIYLDRKDLGSRGQAPQALAVEPGTYTIIVERPGHEPARSEPIEIAVGEQKRVDLSLQRIVGTVEIAVEGHDRAEVRVRDESGPVACMAPCSLELPPGTHLLYFQAPGFQAAPRQIAVQANAVTKTTAKLTALSGSVVVEADEDGAVIRIDGEPRGFTPAVVPNVAIGRHTLSIAAPGFKPYERQIDVEAQRQTEVVDVQLVPLREVQAVSRVREDVDLAPSSLTIIDGQELRAFGYPTIAEAIRGVRGVYLSDDRSYVSVGIRGIGEPNDYGNRVLVLQDGLSLNDNLLNSSYIGSDARVTLHDVQRIEVIRGPGSLLYGTGAMSGVINLVPRGPESPSQVYAGLGTYDNAVGWGRAGFHYNITEDAGAWASVAGARSEGFALPVTLIDPAGGPPEQLADNTDRFRSVGTLGRAWWGPVNAQWLYHQRRQNVPIGALGAAFGDPRTVYFDERFAGEVRFEPQWESFALFTRAHANHYHFDGRYISPPPDAHFEEDLYGTWFGAEARAVLTPYPGLRITIGGEGQFHPVATMRGTEVDDTFTPVADGTYLDEKRPYNFGAGYALIEVVPVDWFAANAGVRVDVYSTFGPIVVPRGALVFRPAEGGVLKVMAGRAFRAPSIYEQFYNDGGFSQVAAVDESRGLDLGPESIVSGEIEYLQRFLDNWVAIGAVHASYVDGIINTVQDTPGSAVIRYANGESPAMTFGGDVEIRREWRRGWMLSAFYSHQRARFVDPPEPTGDPRLTNAPQHLAGFRGAVPLYQDVIVLAARAALEAPRRIDLATSDETRPAVVADLAFSGNARRFGVHYSLGVYNLFDWTYRVPVAETFASRSMVQNGRTFLADVSVAWP